MDGKNWRKFVIKFKITQKQIKIIKIINILIKRNIFLIIRKKYLIKIKIIRGYSNARSDDPLFFLGFHGFQHFSFIFTGW